MEYGASKSDIDFEFDSSGSSDDDVSISTNASSEPPTPLSRVGVRGMIKKFDKASLHKEDDGHDFLRGIGDDDSDGNSDLSIGSEELMSPRARNGGDKRCRRRDSEDFGPPIVVPLKTGSDHTGGDGNEPIEPGSRSSRSSRRSNRSTRSGSFNRRAPVRTKSGEGMTNSTHSAASGRRRPPARTKSGEGIVKNDEEGVSNHRRRPPPRTKSGNADGIRRRLPQRTKSGGTLRGGKKENGDGNGEESIFYEEKLPEDDDSYDDSAVPTSPAMRHKSAGHEDSEYREMALKRNSARRQRSSDTLGAMRDATRNMPSRSQSSAGISNGRRRGPSRSKSGGIMGLRGSSAEELASPGRKPLRRKAPPRTKSGGRLIAPPLET